MRGVLGAGSTGWVVKVADEALGGELVALKIIYPHLLREESCLNRLRREVVLARQLAHPLIVHVHDFEEHVTGETFLAMEYVRGANLAELLLERSARGFPLDEALLILSKIAEALLYAHQQGVVHRDLKPSNILVARDGTVRLSDFGIAQSFELELGLTRTGEAPGTPAYMAPEQFRGEPCDQRTDIYAFGLLAFELISGLPPFREEDYFLLAERQVHEDLPPLTSSGDPVPPWLESLVRSCCAKNPQDRPHTVAAFLPVLQREVPHATVVRVPPRDTENRRRVRRFLRAAVVLATAIALFEWAYAQFSFRVWLMTDILTFEARMGFELLPLKWPLRINASLLRPASMFDAIASNDRYELAAMVAADRRMRQRAQWSENHVSPLELKDLNGLTAVQEIVRTNDSRLINDFTVFPLQYFSVLDGEGETPLTYAIRHQLMYSVNAVLALHGVPVNAPNARLETPLHLAVQAQNHPLIGNLLHYHEANATLRDANGVTPIHVAVRNGDVETLDMMRGNDADFSTRDHEGRTALMDVIRTNAPDSAARRIAKLMLSSKRFRAAIIAARDNSARTALIYAVQANRTELVSLLLTNGAESDARDASGRNAFDYAREPGIDPDIIAALEATRSGAAVPAPEPVP